MLGPLAKNLSTASMIGMQIISMALVPILIAAMAFCAAGILHLVFQLLGSNGQSFEVTFRAYCYAVAPASVFRLIPICGDVFFLCHGLVLLIFALRETLRVDGVRATIGVVLPVFVVLRFLLGRRSACCGSVGAGRA